MFNINKTVDEIFDEEKDTKFEDIIKKFLNGSVAILVALVIILLCSIFGLEFDWGILDRDILISVVPTVLGGYFGFVGGVVGIVCAYFIYTAEMRTQKKILEEEKLAKKDYSLDMLCCLLDTTITETDEILPRFIDKSKYYWEHKTYEPYLNEMENDLLMENTLHLSKVNFYEKPSDLLKFNSIIISDEFGDLGFEFQDSINRDINMEDIIYDENWCNYLAYIDDKNKKYRKKIIKWIKLIKETQIILYENSDGQSISYIDIYNFISYRDEIIKFLKLYGYKNHELYEDIFKNCIYNKG